MKNYFLPPTLWALSLAAMLSAHEWLPIMHIQPAAWRSSLGLFLLAASLGITVWHKRIFRRANTNVNTFDIPDKLIEEGLFKYTRNPMYLGFVASLASAAFVMGALSPWIIVGAFFLLTDLWYIPYEERVMYAKFGGQYEAYCSRTHRWI
jgi:protein-S-isoprenylcysteine O-methyltransferase Ste14